MFNLNMCYFLRNLILTLKEFKITVENKFILRDFFFTVENYEVDAEIDYQD